MKPILMCHAFKQQNTYFKPLLYFEKPVFGDRAWF